MKEVHWSSSSHQMPNFINFLATSEVAIIIIVVIFITCKSLRHLYLSIPPLSGQWSSSLHKMKQLTLSLSLILLKHEMPNCFDGDDGYHSHIPRWEGNWGERKEKQLWKSGLSWEYAEFTLMKFTQRRILLIDKKFYAVEMDPLHRRVESKHSGQRHNCEDK